MHIRVACKCVTCKQACVGSAKKSTSLWLSIYSAETVEPYVFTLALSHPPAGFYIQYTHLGRHDKGVVYIHPCSASNWMLPHAVWQSRSFQHYKRPSSVFLVSFSFVMVRHKFTCSVPYQTKISVMHMHTANRAWQLIGHMHDPYKTPCSTPVSPDLTQKTTVSATGFRIIKHVIVWKLILFIIYLRVNIIVLCKVRKVIYHNCVLIWYSCNMTVSY
jgi:hypothetical protein